MLKQKEYDRAVERAFADIISRCNYAKIETDICEGKIVNVRIVQNIKINETYLKEEGYLKQNRDKLVT